MATVQINVLKPFRFSYLATPGSGAVIERPFAVGVHDIDEEDPMLAHPWIARDFADGRIERPEARAAREAEAECKQKLARADADAQLALAEAAYRRTVKTVGTRVVDRAALDEELNTPIGELRARGQLSGNMGAINGGADLNKTIDQLRAEQGAEPAAAVIKAAGKAAGKAPRP